MKIYNQNNDELQIYLIATPIGNNEESSFLSLKILKNASLIICEDTRRTKDLLKKNDINFEGKKFIFLNKFNENSQTISEKIYQECLSGKTIAMVSDAGYPLVSDPGFKVVRFLREKDIYIKIINGPNSILPALVLSGFPTDSFYFGGFLNNKITQKIIKLNYLKEIKTTLIFFESINKIDKFLDAIYRVFGENIEICICREISKTFEEVLIGTVKEFIDKEWIKKGEIVVLINNK
ncbi:MAG: 16S rRNA (cytidine(1402)-2'-O)-methyltransferase [Mycoplasma sp.]